MLENPPLVATSYSTSQVQQPVLEVNDSDHSEDLQLVARARAVGVQYEFAQPVAMETEDDRRKRKRRNQRRVSDEEKRLREVVGDLPPPPPAGSSQIEDNAYCAIRSFEVQQMTYKFGCCEVCKERPLECKATGNTCTRCRRDKKVPKVWSDENNMDPSSVPDELSGMSDAEQMLISKTSTHCSCTHVEAWGYCFKRTLHCISSGCARTSNYPPTATSRDRYYSCEKTREK